MQSKTRVTSCHFSDFSTSDRYQGVIIFLLNHKENKQETTKLEIRLRSSATRRELLCIAGSRAAGAEGQAAMRLPGAMQMEATAAALSAWGQKQPARERATAVCIASGSFGVGNRTTAASRLAVDRPPDCPGRAVPLHRAICPTIVLPRSFMPLFVRSYLCGHSA